MKSPKEYCRAVKVMRLLTTLIAVIIKSNNKDANSYLNMDSRKSFRVKDSLLFHLDKLLRQFKISNSKSQLETPHMDLDNLFRQR
jgi:hypothetical protein